MSTIIWIENNHFLVSNGTFSRIRYLSWVSNYFSKIVIQFSSIVQEFSTFSSSMMSWFTSFSGVVSSESNADRLYSSFTNATNGKETPVEPMIAYGIHWGYLAENNIILCYVHIIRIKQKNFWIFVKILIIHDKSFIERTLTLVQKWHF